MIELEEHEYRYKPWPGDGFNVRDRFVYGLIRIYGPICRKDLMRYYMAKFSEDFKDFSQANKYLNVNLNRLYKFGFITKDEESQTWRVL